MNKEFRMSNFFTSYFLVRYSGGHGGPPYARLPRVAKHCGQVGSATAPTFWLSATKNTSFIITRLLDIDEVLSGEEIAAT